MKGATILGLLLLLASCGSNTIQEAGVSTVEALASRGVPPGSGGGCAPPTTNAYSVAVTCDLTTSWTEDSYRNWIERQLSGRFRAREMSGGRLLMTRDSKGEVQQFDIVTTPLSDSSTRIRIVLTVYAD